MKPALLVFAILVLAVTSTKTVEFPQHLRSYTTWQRITPDRYSVPSSLSRLCVAPPHPGQVIEDSDYNSPFGPFDEAELSSVPVGVFANPVALTSVFTKDQFPEGSILIKEKQQGPAYASTTHQGVMIKTKKGWEFSYYPYVKGATFEACAACHKTAEHDFVFTPYLKKK